MISQFIFGFALAAGCLRHTIAAWLDFEKGLGIALTKFIDIGFYGIFGYIFLSGQGCSWFGCCK